MTFLAVTAIAVVLGAMLLEVRGWRQDAAQQEILRTFTPALAATRQDPRLLLIWVPLARAARKMDPETFARLDAAMGATFPFTKAQIDEAHAAWTTAWLAWEGSHDAEYRLKAAMLEEELARQGMAGSPTARSRRDAVEREKLERYQQRYGEYIRTAKALQALEP